MPKLSLEIEALRVESFETDAPPAERGTVLAHAKTNNYTCAATCFCPPSAEETCGCYTVGCPVDDSLRICAEV